MVPISHRKLFRKLRAALRQDPGFDACGRVVVGLSGGPDSVVLLHLLCALRDRGRPEVIAAHVHHGVRGKEADRDAKVAEKVARTHGCEFHVLHLSKASLKGAAEHSLRDGRLKLLQGLATTVGAGRVALAHHRDDQAETILFRLLGGTDLRGLSGIKVFRPPVWIRPLLNVSRSEILEEARGCRLPYVVDSTNRETKARRNYLRQIVIPMLEKEFNPQLSRHLLALAESIGSVNEFLETEAFKLLKRARQGNGALKASVLGSASSALRGVALQKAFRDVAGEGAALRRPQLDAIERMILTTGRLRTFSLPRDVLAVREKDRIEFRRSR